MGVGRKVYSVTFSDQAGKKLLHSQATDFYVNIQNNYNNEKRYAGTRFSINLVKPNKIFTLCHT